MLVSAVSARGIAAAGEATDSQLQEEAAILQQAQILSRAFAIVAKRIKPSVVHIKVERVAAAEFRDSPFDMFEDLLRRRFPGRFPPRQRSEAAVGTGSGVIVDSRGYILTNNHVVGGADNIIVRLSDGREVQAELVGADPDSDIAVIRIAADRLTPAILGDSDDCEVGECVMAMGSPFGLEATVTTGIISARGRSNLNIVEIEDFIQTDAAINPGNSGGPLVNLKGEVIGINSAIFSRSGGYQGVGFAIPINIARTVMKGLIANKRVTASYLGAGLQALTPALARTFGIESPRGALVTEVFADTPAARAGLRRGDVIVQYGKRAIEDDQQLRNLIATTDAGEEVEMVVIRSGKSLTLRVKVEAKPETVVLQQGKQILEALGIEVGDLTPTMRQRLGYETTAWGVLVTSVVRGSTAAGIGIRPGTLILKVDDVEVRTPDELKNALGSARARRGINLVWRTGRFVHGVRLMLGE